MRGDGRIFQRGTRWWIAYYGPGPGGRTREYREPGGLTEKAAIKRLRDRMNEVTNHLKGIATFTGRKQERVTIETLLTQIEREYEIRGKRSLPQLRSHLKHIRAYFGLDRALAVTEERLRHYIAHRQEEGAAPATVNRELEGLQRAFSLGVELKMLTQAVMPSFPSLPEQNAREGFFEKQDFDAVLSHLRNTDVRDFVEFFYWTGMRPGEIRSLTWAAFDRETWTLRLHARGAKTGHGRTLALEGPLRSIIQRRLAVRRLDCQHIFHRKGKQVGEFRKTWKTACTKAGLAGQYLIYDLRRTAVRNMVRAGVDPAVAMKISGHRTRAIFDRYNIISDDDIRTAVLKTSEYVSALPTASNVVPLASTAAAHNF